MDVDVFWQGEFEDSLFGKTAEEETDGGVFVGKFYLAIKAVHDHLHLAEILVAEIVEHVEFVLRLRACGCPPCQG